MQKSCSRLAPLLALASAGLASAQPPATPPAGAPADVAGGLPETPPKPKVIGVWYGHVESDNLSRTAAEQKGYYDGLGLLLGLGHESSRLEARVDGDLEYRTYSLDELDHEVAGTLSADAEVDIIKDRFSWTFNEDFGQGITDPFGGIGPRNREEVNVLGTGPKLGIPLGARSSLEMLANYSERRFNNSTSVDNDSIYTELGLYRQLSVTSRVGFLITSDDVDYVEVLAPKYQIDRYAFRYEKQLATGRVRADLGENDISTAGFEQSEPLYRFLWTRSLTARSELSIRAARELTDAGAVLASLLVPDEGPSFTDVIVTPNPLQQKRLGATYALTMSRTVISAELGTWKDEYIGNAAFDNDAITMHLQLVRTITPRLTWGIGYDDVDRDFRNDGAQPDSEDSWVATWLNHSIGPRFNLGFAISKYDRSGIDSYDEQRYEIRFGYSPTESGAAAMGRVGR